MASGLPAALSQLRSLSSPTLHLYFPKLVSPRLHPQPSSVSGVLPIVFSGPQIQLPEGDPQLPPCLGTRHPTVPSGKACLGVGAPAVRQGQRGDRRSSCRLLHSHGFLLPSQKKKKDKAGMRRRRKNKQGRKTTGGEGYGYKTHFSISFSYKLQIQCTGVSKEANSLLSPQTMHTSLLAVTLLPPRSPQAAGQNGGCQSFGGALMRAQKSKSFETLPDW